MNKITGLLLGSYLLFAGMGIAVAQETTPPPKVLAVSREFLKPGRNGAMHDKSESAFVQAMTRAKWPTHYLALNSITGKPRALFLTGYDSFEAWEKDVLAEQGNATLSAALEKANVADGDLLSDYDSSALVYRDDYSLRSAVDIPHMRYFEISLYRVRPGHNKEWDTLVKMVMAAYEKVPDVHWAMYQARFGQEDGTYVVFTPMKSASEVDQSFGQSKKFMQALGEDGVKKLDELEASAVEFYQYNLFAFSPAMSYVSDDWIKADPDFWKPKASPMATKKAAEKPAQ
jgi:hypothetical protein